MPPLSAEDGMMKSRAYLAGHAKTEEVTVEA
jgi:hypothetical protein